MFVGLKVKNRIAQLLAMCYLALISSCVYETKQLEPLYFDVASFTEQHLGAVANQRCTVSKIFKINSEEESQEMVVINDSIFWQKEFKVFLEHDINKPVLRDAFQVIKGTTEDGSAFVDYLRKDSAASGVLSMRVVYNESNQINFWESQYRDENALYSNQRYVRMDVINNPLGTRLEQYRVKGFHKLILKDSVHYEMVASLRY